MDQQHHLEAAEAIFASRQAVQGLAPLPVSCRPETLADGYAIQQSLHQKIDAHGGSQRGWKIGCTNKILQDLLGIHHPCAGVIMSENTHDSGAILRWSNYVRPGIECEVAFEIGEDLPAAEAPWTRDTVLARVAAIMPAIEVVDDRYGGDYAGLGTPTLIADDFFQAGAVLGPRIENFRDIDLANIAAATFIDGQTAGTGTGADVMGHPAEPLAWLADILAERGRGLKRGDIVLTGSMVNVQWLTQPCEARIENAALGSVTVAFA